MSMCSKQITHATLILTAALFSTHAAAGGLWLNEFGDFAGGRASAGAAAGTDEAATIIHNPASAGGVPSHQLFASAGYLYPQVEFDVADSGPLLGDDDGGSAGVGAPAASFAYVNDFGSERWHFGTYMAGMAGAGLDYNDDWVGRYQTTEVSLLVLAIAATAAYDVTEKLSVGIAPQLYFASLDLDVNVPALANPGGPDNRATIDGDDSGFGFMAGATYQWSPQTRLGIAYQSEFEVNFDGDLRFRRGASPELQRQVATDTELTMAAKLRASLHHDFSDRLGLDFSIGWDDWSALDNVFVNVDTTGGGRGLKKNWRDTYHYAAGFQYALNEAWDMTMGLSYDTNPVDAADRTADLPVDRQVRYNIGARVQHSEALTLGGYLNYTDLGSARISGRFLSGEYDGENSVWQLALYLNWQI